MLAREKVAAGQQLIPLVILFLGGWFRPFVFTFAEHRGGSSVNHFISHLDTQRQRNFSPSRGSQGGGDARKDEVVYKLIFLADFVQKIPENFGASR